MNLKDRMLSKISQAQKNKYCMISLTGGTKNSLSIDTESRILAAKGFGEGEMGVII